MVDQVSFICGMCCHLIYFSICITLAFTDFEIQQLERFREGIYKSLLVCVVRQEQSSIFWTEFWVFDFYCPKQFSLAFFVYGILRLLGISIKYNSVNSEAHQQISIVLKSILKWFVHLPVVTPKQSSSINDIYWFRLLWFWDSSVKHWLTWIFLMSVL